MGGGNANANLYDGSTRSFSSAGGIGAQRTYHTATLLLSGKVLIVGGSDNSGQTQNTAQIYDPVTREFTSTGNMTVDRDFHTATLLLDGKVLITGGRSGNPRGYTSLSSAEIYNPATGTFTATGHMTIARFQHTATMLDGGTVLLTGGVDATGVTTATAEIYDPATHTFTATASMSDSRAQLLATAIGLGAVLVAGGYSNDGQTVTTLASGQSYNGAFTPLLTDMIEPRAQTTVTSLSGSGLFILTGGAKFVLANCGNNCVTVVPQSLSTTEGFSSFDLDFFPEPSMNTARRGHTATLLADGSTILIVGGANSTLGARNELVDTVLSSAELFH